MKQGPLLASVAIVVAVVLGVYIAFFKEGENARQSADSSGTASVSLPASEETSENPESQDGSEKTAAEGTGDATSGAKDEAAAGAETEPTGETEIAAVDPKAEPEVVDAAVQPQGDVEEASDTSEQTAPSFDLVRVEKSGEVVVAGRAPAGSTVTVMIGDVILGTVMVGASGSWVIVPNEVLGPGSHQLTIRADLADGSVLWSANAAVVAVPEPTVQVAAAGGAASAEGQPDEAAGSGTASASEEEEPGPLVVLVPNTTEGASEVLQKPFAVVEGGIKQDELTLETVDYNDEGKAVVSGTADPGSKVVVYLDNQPLAVAEVGADGKWPATLDAPIEPGLHTLRVDQLDGSGKVVSRVEAPFSRAEVGDVLVAEHQVIVQPGNSLWRIARRIYGKGFHYTVIYDANDHHIVDPHLIYPGQVFTLPTVQ